MRKNFKKELGYTIIETMIAVSLFIIIIMAGMGALLNANLLHQKSRDMRSILDNLSFVMEDMSRNLRTGTSYRCYFNVNGTIDPSAVNLPRSCPSGWGLAFESQNGTALLTDQWIYYIGTYNGKVGIFKSVDGSASFVQLTPDEVTINTVASSFSVLGAEPLSSGNQQQPFIVIRLVGTITFKNVVTPFSLQTSVSQRLVDI